ncbi:class I SAM-dependent methyltransferase [Bryobacter aggregatus]|uniref:class I SAM-dependent methyltransferase n=1 Tax=Bryobacter aggregatus TaxID=360054 RepID=UPI0004E22F13|nr:class I SAM-dependent methyltransferase [Bryobacter aggregatus]
MSSFFGSYAAPVVQHREKEYWEDHLTDKARMGPQEEWLRYSRETYAAWVRQYLSGGERVLKTDCFEEIRGTEIVDALTERYGQVVIGDLAVPALQQAAHLCKDPKLNWVQSAAQNQPLADASFDAVTSFSTLDHFRSVEEISQSLRDLARLTRPGGQLLITLDNDANPLISIRNLLPNKLLCRLGLAPYEYGRTLGPQAFRAALEDSGWRVKTFTSVIHQPRVLAVAMSRFCNTGGLLTPCRYRLILHPFEMLGRLPTRMLSGYFLLAHCHRAA